LIYREWAAPQGFRDTLMMTVMKEPSRIGFLGLTRREEQRRYDDRDRELMRLLSPHIRRVVKIADLLDHRTLERDRFVEVVDALTTSVILIAADGRLLHANRSGRDLLQRKVMLVVRAGCVEAADPTDEQAFRKARQPDLSDRVARTVRLSRDAERPVIASILPLARVPGSQSAPAQFAIFVQEVGRYVPLAAEMLGQQHHLTGAELRVLLGMMGGSSIREIAERYGISETTVKTHLRSLFVKTGTQRQAELVELALSSVTPTLKPG